MNAQDLILVALKVGTPLNPNNRVYRSIAHLAALAGVDVPQVQELLLGDLAAEVAVKPSQKHGWMVRLRSEGNQAAGMALKGLVAAANKNEELSEVIDAEFPPVFKEVVGVEFPPGLEDEDEDEDVEGLGADELLDAAAAAAVEVPKITKEAPPVDF